MPETILMYAQDNRGLGHIRRTTTIARAVLGARPHVAVMLASKSAWPANLDLGDRFEFLKLPGQFLAKAALKSEREEQVESVRGLRRSLLREAAQALAPSLVLMDNQPLGARGEMEQALDAAQRANPDTRLVFGMRDVVDDPDETIRLWQETGVLKALEERFHRVLIYGHPELVDSAVMYRLPDAIAAKAVYTGYVCSTAENTDPRRIRDLAGVGDGPLVLITTGGGQDGAPLLRAGLAAAALLAPKVRMLVVTGPFLPAADLPALLTAATLAGAVVRTQLDVREAIAASDAVVCMGGYNTLAEAMLLGRRPIVVPRSGHKREQLLRAQAFAKRGLARCLTFDQLTPESLAGEIASELESSDPPDSGPYLDKDGLRTAGLLIEELAQAGVGM
jgi:predicted glycosyltransferase